MNRFRMGSQTWTIVRKARSDILFFNKTPLFRYYRFRNQRQQMPLIAYGRQKRGFTGRTSSYELGALN